MEIRIRKIGIGDVEMLQKISVKTFSETFSHDNAADDIQQYLDKSFGTEKLASELGNLESEFYFAENEHKVLGYLKINTGEAQTEKQPFSTVEIERIYVAKEFLGLKIGQMLFEKALQRAEQMSADYLWLGVWEQNERAITFYQKNGFEVFGKHDFVLGTDVQTDLMMRKTLK